MKKRRELKFGFDEEPRCVKIGKKLLRCLNKNKWEIVRKIKWVETQCWKTMWWEMGCRCTGEVALTGIWVWEKNPRNMQLNRKADKMEWLNNWMDGRSAYDLCGEFKEEGCGCKITGNHIWQKRGKNSLTNFKGKKWLLTPN